MLFCRLRIQMKLLRYNSNREVSGPIILLRLTPLLELYLEFQRIIVWTLWYKDFWGWQKIYLQPHFFGVNRLYGVWQKARPIFSFLWTIFIFIFLFDFSCSKQKDISLAWKLWAVGHFGPGFNLIGLFLVLMASSFHLPVTIIHKYPPPPTPSLGYL